MHIRTFAFILIFLLAQELRSQTCCSGGIPLSNNLGLVNEGKGNLLIGLNYDFNNLNTLNVGKDKLDDDSRKRITHSALLNFGYSISDRLSVETLFTWVNQRRAINQFGNTDLQQTSGIGDAVFLLKYDFPKTIGDKSNLSVGAGTKVPLGSYNEVDRSGITYIADLQPGSGAWDLILYAAISKNFDFRPTMTFSSRIIGRLTGSNKDYLDGASTYEYGDEFQFFLGVSDQFLVFNTITNPGISFKYRKAKRDIIEINELDNTGGEWLFINPNLGIQLSPTIRFQLKAEIPLIGNVDGTQLTPTYRITSGFLFNLSSKRNALNLNIDN
jgi:hypothetical protein